MAIIPFHIPVTPALAKKIIFNDLFAKMFISKIFWPDSAGDIYSELMKLGAWDNSISPKGVFIDNSGQLMDGHNRISAIIKSNTTQIIHFERLCNQSMLPEDIPCGCKHILTTGKCFEDLHAKNLELLKDIVVLNSLK